MRRGLLRRARSATLVRKGVRGLTSNPTIFEKAIVASGDYEEALRSLVAAGARRSRSTRRSRSRTSAARAICCCRCYEASGRRRRAGLARGAARARHRHRRTVAEGLRLAKAVGRPNVMIKVPATPEGIPAIRALTAAGVSVNVTLIFSLLQYEEVLEAYLAGLEDRLAAGGGFAGLASVASFFVSRVDSVCDKLLTAKAAAAATRRPRAPRRCSASSRSRTPSSPTRSTSARARRRAGRSSPPRGRTPSACCGRRPAPRIPATPTRTTSTR